MKINYIIPFIFQMQNNNNNNKIPIPSYVIILGVFFCLLMLDSLWFAVSLKGLYHPIFIRIEHRKKDSKMFFRMVPAIITWLLLAIGMYTFVLSDYFTNFTNSTKLINHEKQKKLNLQSLLMKGALFGLITYGVYNFTNYATLQQYPLGLALVDTLWGMTAMTLTSFLASFIFLKYF